MRKITSLLNRNRIHIPAKRNYNIPVSNNKRFSKFQARQQIATYNGDNGRKHTRTFACIEFIRLDIIYRHVYAKHTQAHRHNRITFFFITCLPVNMNGLTVPRPQKVLQLNCIINARLYRSLQCGRMVGDAV